MHKKKSKYDVLIVGGGPAGLSAALSLARLGLRALVADDGRPRNAPASHMHNFPGRDGQPPAEWRAEAIRDLKRYETTAFVAERVTEILSRPNGFSVSLHSGQSIWARKVILAEGIQDRLPAIEGLAELWGKSVFHCVFCHGYEMRGKALGFIGSGPMVEHGLANFYGVSKDLILFTNGPADLSDSLRSLMKARGVELYEQPIVRLHIEQSELKAVELQGGLCLERKGLFVAPQFPVQMKSSLGDLLGCQRDDHGFYKIDARCKTSVPGVFSAGDNSTMMQSVLQAAAQGSLAGAAAGVEVLAEDFVAGDAFSS